MDNNSNNNIKAKNTESIIADRIEIKEDIYPEILESLKGTPVGEGLIVVLKGPNVGEKIIISKPLFTIGRESDSDIFLDDITISRKHAQIVKSGNYYKIIDLGSLNGIYVNGKLSEEKILENGDKIQIGKYVFFYFYFE